MPPFEPLNIRTAEFEQVPVLTGPILINADPAPFSDPDAGDRADDGIRTCGGTCQPPTHRRPPRNAAASNRRS